MAGVENTVDHEVDSLTMEEMVELSMNDKTMTTSHFVDSSTRSCCQTKTCKQVFGKYPSFRRPHHCKRCGEVFCRPCLRHRRRLNKMAQPDPLGVPSKVCPQCFEEREFVGVGVTRSQTKDFQHIREMCKKEMKDIECEVVMYARRATVVPSYWKEQFKVDILKECKRLLDGFSKGIRRSDINIAKYNAKKAMSRYPDWQKSTFFVLEQDSEICRECNKHISKMSRAKHCSICGVKMCKYCCIKELLLYFADKPKTPKDKESPRIAIIKYKGCPSVEPKFSLLLHCCKECKATILAKQTADADWFREIDEADPKYSSSYSADIVSIMHVCDEKFRTLTLEINHNLDKLEAERVTAHNEALQKEADKDGNAPEQGVIEEGVDVVDGLEDAGMYGLRKYSDARYLSCDSLDSLDFLADPDAHDLIREKLDSFMLLCKSLEAIYRARKDLIQQVTQVKLAKTYLHTRHAFYNTSNSRLLKLTS